MKLLTSAATAAFFMLVVPHVASAQDLGSNFKRDRNVTVRERPRPDYEAKGIKAGGFTVYPRVTGSVERNDNIYATAIAEQDDTIWRVKPEVAIRSDWSRHALGAFASATINRYSDFDTENTEEYTVGVNGRADITRGSNVTGSLQYQKRTEPRTSPTSPLAAATPVEYSLVTGSVIGVKEFNRIRLTGRLTDRNYNYDDVRNIAGGVLDQDARDRNEIYYGLKAEYAVSPDTALFGSIVGNTKNYDLATSGRDSDGYSATVGANFELSSLVRGEIEIGYMDQSYDLPIYDDIDGVSAKAEVEWFPTQLTTVTFDGSRTIEEAVATGSQGYISNNVSASVDHELLRNVLLSAEASYGKDDYQSIDRNDKRTGASAGVTYLINRNVGVFLTYTYLKQESSGGQRGSSFSDNKLAASIALQF
ncbi:outer membrane beta-barrel protein [Caulobacter sp. UNC358MFTsu5.1]|uniref:outer membrane beta-barrel protein n=1 Tax=Caulobacter sp. UNC358MFTsu5.1 TaxID=1449049 RepID=UPI0004A718C4|nr:outer membrane beta-barrel protein [Caulobacter sp. UNC358MFTsu5.1]